MTQEPGLDLRAVWGLQGSGIEQENTSARNVRQSRHHSIQYPDSVKIRGLYFPLKVKICRPKMQRSETLSAALAGGAEPRFPDTTDARGLLYRLESRCQQERVKKKGDPLMLAKVSLC